MKELSLDQVPLKGRRKSCCGDLKKEVMLKKSPDWRTWPVQLGAKNSHTDTIVIPEPTKQTPEFQFASGLQQILFTGDPR